MIGRIYFSMCLVLSSCVCTADEIEKMPNFKSDDSLSEQEIAHAKELAGLDTMLYGGRPVDEGDLPMVYNVGFCTVSVVGPEVIFIASHCVSNGSKASFIHAGVRRTGVCSRHPQYNDRTVQFDWALCKFSPKIEDENYIYSSLEPKLLTIGDKVVLNGFGKGSSNGRLHWGKMPIVRITSQEYITEGSTVLGSGDSGGSLFADMVDLKAGPFHTVGVNSRAGGGMSIFNYTAHESAQNFFKVYASTQSVKICGVNLNPCKNSSGELPKPPDPPDPPKPEVPGFCSIEKMLVDTLAERLKFFQKGLDACSKIK